MPAPNGRTERSRADRAGSRSGVEPDENKPRDMLADVALRFLVAHDLLGAPRRSDDLGCLVARQPIRPGRGLVGQNYRHDLRAETFPSMMVDRGSQILQLAPGGIIC